VKDKNREDSRQAGVHSWKCEHPNHHLTHVRRLLASLWVAASLLSVAVPARAVSSAELLPVVGEQGIQVHASLPFPATEFAKYIRS